MCKKLAIVLDVDGVLLKSDIIHQEIFELKLKGDAMWDYFYEHCNSERIPFIYEMLPLLYSFDSKVHILLSTARNEKCRKGTERKLKATFPEWKKLYMRKDGDYRSSAEVKKDHLEEIQESYNILAFIDDDLSNCQMARDMGIVALRKV